VWISGYHNGRADSLSFIISPVCPYVSENFSPLQTSAGFKYHFYRIVLLLQCAGVNQNLSIVFVIILGIDMIVRLLADYELPQTRGSFVFLFTDYQIVIPYIDRCVSYVVLFVYLIFVYSKGLTFCFAAYSLSY